MLTIKKQFKKVFNQIHHLNVCMAYKFKDYFSNQKLYNNIYQQKFANEQEIKTSKDPQKFGILAKKNQKYVGMLKRQNSAFKIEAYACNNLSYVTIKISKK